MSVRRADADRAAVDARRGAVAEPLLTLSTSRVAVVKSGSLRFRMIASPCADLRGNRALDGRAVRDAPGARHVDGELRAIVGLHAEAADDQIALRDRVDLPIEAVQRRDQQRSAAQALGIRDRVDGDVDGLPRLDERRQHRVHRHRRDVLQLRRHVGRHRDAELREHVRQRLHRERRLAGLVAGAVQADHEAVADELVGAHALHLRHVLDALGAAPAAGAASAPSASAQRACSTHARDMGADSERRKRRVEEPRQPAHAGSRC